MAYIDIRELTERLGYTAAEFHAAACFFRRKNRLEHPPGGFDGAGRFIAEERTEAVCRARSPSRKWPYSQMNAARTAEHCAELYDAGNLTHVRRIAAALEKDTLLESENLLKIGFKARMAAAAAEEKEEA